MGKPRFEQSCRGNNFDIILEDTVDKVAEGSLEVITIGIVVIIEAGIGLERDHSQKTIAVIELELLAVVDLSQDPEPVLIGI